MHVNGNGAPDFAKMAADNSTSYADLVMPSRPSGERPIPPLPEAVQHDPDLAATACPWLDEYVQFSSRWSPRAHDDFHESVGLWMLSTVAARRVALDLGKRRFTSLYIALCSRTSVFAKSTTAEIAQVILQEAGLSFLLAPDDATPQAFVRSMTYRLPNDWDEMSTAQQDAFKQRVAFASQKGWFYDEFGQKVSAMMRDGGHMADFRGLLRKFDDTPDLYEYETIGRGKDAVYCPYLALLANLTPADLQPYAKRNSALWNDGFWARYAFLTPPAYAPRKNGRFPNYERHVPPKLVTQLRQWHNRLGTPTVEIMDRETDGSKTKHDLLIAPPDPKLCTLGDGVYDAFYNYSDALIDIVASGDLTDLDGNYSRLPEKALRVAMLIASLENNERIEMQHWARAQQVAEVWRRNLHNLYDQIVTVTDDPKLIAMEDRIFQLIAERGPVSKREACQNIRGLDSDTANKTFKALVEAGYLQAQKDGRTERFGIIVSDQSVDVDA